MIDNIDDKEKVKEIGLALVALIAREEKKFCNTCGKRCNQKQCLKCKNKQAGNDPTRPFTRRGFMTAHNSRNP